MQGTTMRAWHAKKNEPTFKHRGQAHCSNLQVCASILVHFDLNVKLKDHQFQIRYDNVSCADLINSDRHLARLYANTSSMVGHTTNVAVL